MNEKLQKRLRVFFIHWCREHGRTFPWRAEDVSPYGVLVAEMMLRQTRAEMVARIWPDFMACYPTSRDCANAPEDELFRVIKWLGLGKQRTHALRSAAAALEQRHGGRIPRSVGKLLAIPHVGIYAAHAVACFAFNQRIAIVDVNVIRIMARLIGQNFPLDPRRGKGKAIWPVVESILPKRFFREHNYGILDFSAQICVPQIPKCDQCPLSNQCMTGLTNLVPSPISPTLNPEE